MRYLGRHELGVSQGHMIAMRRAGQKRSCRAERGFDRPLTYVPGEGQIGGY